MTHQQLKWSPNLDKQKRRDRFKIPQHIVDASNVRDGETRKIGVRTDLTVFEIEARISSGCEILVRKEYQERLLSASRIELELIPDQPLNPSPPEEIVYTNPYTPADIKWIKNVTNPTKGHAYMDDSTAPFLLHFPTKHKTNVLGPGTNEIIIVYQTIDGSPVFTHLVTPIDPILMEDSTRSKYRFGRQVKVIAKTPLDKVIPIVSTRWREVNFQGISQGNACQLGAVKSITNVADLQLDLWTWFKRHFVSTEVVSGEKVDAIISEIERDYPELSASEGKSQLITHFIKERDRRLVKAKKEQALQAGKLTCEVCDFSFQRVYGADFIECHHLTPIGQSGERVTRLDDLALVCANCHRMLHKKFEGAFLMIDQLRGRIRS